MTFVQLGRGLSESDIALRLLMSLADRLEGPVHFVPPIAFLPECDEWPLRGILVA